MNSMEVVERIWQQVEPTVFISRNEFLASLVGWDIVSREIDGEVAGATLTRGPEFHFVSFGTRKAIPPALMVDCLQPIIERHGFIQTKTPRDDARQRRFNIRLGFYVLYEDEFYTYFRLDQLNLHRVLQCLS